MNILMSQELLKNSLHVLDNSVEQQEEATQLLDLIIDGKWDELTAEEKQDIEKSVWKAMKKNHDDPMLLQVLIKVTGSSGFLQEQSDTLIPPMTMNLMDVMSPDYNEDLLPFTVKLLSTAFAQNPQGIPQFLQILLTRSFKLSDVVHKLVSTPKHFNTVKLFLQFIANLTTIPDPTVAQYFALDPPAAWKIPKLFEF
jgi:hypothetical protein